MMILKDEINNNNDLSLSDSLRSHDNLFTDFDLIKSTNNILDSNNNINLAHKNNKHSTNKSKRKCLSKTKSLYFMMCLSTIVFLLELIIGNATHSNSLVADSFHMLSDLISFVIALLAIKFSKKSSTSKNTYGWARSEVLGSLINAVFLLALCFSIIMEAINRLFEPHPLRRIELIISVGIVGLIINVIGLVLFSLLGGHHFHSHGPNHNHSHHNHHNHKHTHDTLNDTFSSVNDINTQFKFSKLQLQNQNHDYDNDESNMNIRGVFLHVLADALGSLAVILSAFIVEFVPPAEATWKTYVDPILSLVLSMFIIASVLPLFKESSKILLQSVPYDVNIDEIRKNIIKINGVIDIHNFHIWSLNSDSYIATMHLKISKEIYENYLTKDTLMKNVKMILHSNNVHSTTLQFEIESNEFEFYSCCSKDSCLKQRNLSNMNKFTREYNNENENDNKLNSNQNNNNNNNNDSILLCNDNSVILEGHSQFL